MGYRKASSFFVLILAVAFFILVIFFANNPLNRQRKSSLEAFSRDVVVILTGDVMLGRSVMTKSLSLEDPVYPFRKVADKLSEADFVFINLENPIVESCPRTTTGLKFCTLPEMLEGLKLAGVNVANLANNHSRNYGEAGLEETKSHLEERGIAHTGLGKLVVKKEKGIKFGFLGFDFLSKSPKDDDFDLVRKSKEEADVLIVGVHWGLEYTGEPSTLQREWASRLVTEGGAIVVGHGPHWVQGKEESEEGLIYYSLGNFVFDQMWSERTKEGLLVKLTFRDGKLREEELLPIYMQNWAQPEFDARKAKP